MNESHQGDNEGPAIRRFGKFFRGYGIGISLVVSALPLATLLWNLLPIFEGIKPLLTIIASGGSFLLIGIIFSQRHAIARLCFPGLQAGRRRVAHSSELESARFFSLIPMALGLVAVVCLALYFVTINNGVQRVAYLYGVLRGAPDHRVVSTCESLSAGGSPVVLEVAIPGFDIGTKSPTILTCWVSSSYKEKRTAGALVADYAVQFGDELAVEAIRKGTPSSSVPYQVMMGLFFFLAFVCAASAFILTGLKDYLQGEIGLSDRELILQQTVASRRERFDVIDAPGVYGVVEYSPDVPELEPVVSGPFCAWHRLRPEAATIASLTGTVTKWQHVTKDSKDKEQLIECPLEAALTVGQLEQRHRESAAATVRAGYASHT